MSERSKTQKYIQAAAFFIFIIGMPLGSWYFLQKGFDYNKEIMSELHNYGRIPDFSLVNQNGDTLTRADMEGKVLVINFFNKEKSSFPLTMDYLRKIRQFDDRNDIVFVSHALNSGMGFNLNAIAEKEKLNNNHNLFLKGDQVEKLLLEGYQIPDLEKRGEDKKIPRSTDFSKLNKDYPYFVLVDVSGTIRNYYDINNEKSITRMIEHIALILPRSAEEKAELKRETEK